MARLRVLLALVFACLLGCATRAGYEKAMNSYIGAREADLVRALGPSDNTYETGGRKFLQYSSQGTATVAGTSLTVTSTMPMGPATIPSVGAAPAINMNLGCITTFELVADRVVSWSAKGNRCVAPE